MLEEVLSSLAVLALLFGSAGIGMVAAARLPERHQTRETIELMQLTIGLLVTFAAIVLGLLTASVKQSYDATAHDRQEYALQLTWLYQCLEDFGPETDGARADIRSYTAAVIASTWPSEPPPASVEYPNTAGMPRLGAEPKLRTLIDRVGIEIAQLAPSDATHAKMADLCLDRYKSVSHARINVIEDARGDLIDPFYVVLVFWLMVIFGCSGLVAPRHSLSIITIVLAAVSLSTVIFVVLDLSHPYGGFFSIPSTTMRTALASMSSPAP